MPPRKTDRTVPPPFETEEGGVAVAEAPAVAEETAPEAAAAEPTPEPQPKPAPTAEPIRTSRVAAAPPRMVLVYCPDHFNGPRPAIVVASSPYSPEQIAQGERQAINVNVSADGTRDEEFLRLIRASPSGNTFNVNLYDALTPTQREQLIAERPEGITRHAPMWGEWPPRA